MSSILLCTRWRHLFFISLLVGTVFSHAAAENAPTSDEVEFFERRIRPILSEHCYACHSSAAEEVKGGLLLDTRHGIRKGGDSGPAIVPRDVERSLLINALRHVDFEMPPERKLPDRVVADFVHWINLGAPDPRDGGARVARLQGIDFSKARKFWSFRPPQASPPPVTKNVTWSRQPLDAFILARLEKAGLEPNPLAASRTLIRRVSFDLTGLPPMREEVESFVNDPSSQAYERVVQRLLNSPHYGERWARMWLDVARYAEDQAHVVGNNKSLFFPNAYVYRDWVIKALNDDIPYDRFVKLQLAADLLEPDDPTNHAALGFLGLGPKYYNRGRLEVMADEWEDRVDTVTRGLLGLTVACARCHNHKYDPIPTEDYYALAGVFASTKMYNRPIDDSCETDKDGQAKSPEHAIHIVQDGKPTDLNVFVRGDVNSKGPLVKRRFLQVLCRDEPEVFSQGSGRLELAAAIADRDNPLTARVVVNRIWALCFGQPLVGTPSNFGSLGELPTHPRLLDDLAVRFMDGGWSIKRLLRDIVLSATYRQSAKFDPDKYAADPSNRLYWRMNRRRLEVESWRDSVLAVSGRLDLSVGGPSVEPQNPEVRKRTIYSTVSRFELDAMLALFDFPDPNAHSARRALTTTPLQKLFVLNSPFMVYHARWLTERLFRDEDMDEQSLIRRAYLSVYGRPATDGEVRVGIQFVRRGDALPADRWQQYAQVLLASNELMFID